MLLLALTAIAAATGLGLDRSVRSALARALPDGWSAEVGRVDGSWLGSLELSDLSLEAPALGARVAGAAARFRILPLLSRRLEVRSLTVDAPMIRLDRRPEGTDASSPDLASPTESAADSAAALLPRLLAGEGVGRWTVRVDSVRVRDAGVRLLRSDSSMYAIGGASLVGHVSLDQAGLGVAIDSATASFNTVPSGTSGRAGVIATLDRGRLTLDTLTLTSGTSRVNGGGWIDFAAAPQLVEDLDLRIVGAPLDVRDLPLVLPDGLLPDPAVAITVLGGGRPDSLTVRVEADAAAGGPELSSDLLLRPDHEPAVRAAVRFDRVDLDAISSPPFDGRASGYLEGSLERLEAGARFQAGGTLRHQPRQPSAERFVTRPLEAVVDVSGRTPRQGAHAFAADVGADLVVDGAPAGRLETRIEGTSARWSVDVALDGARVNGTGSARWSQTDVGGTAEDVRVTALDLAAFDSAYLSTRLSGALAGALAIDTAGMVRGGIDASLTTSRFAETSVDTLHLFAVLDGRTADGTLAFEGSPGDLHTHFEASLADSLLEVDADSLRYARVDSAGRSASLAGRGRARWTLGPDRRGRVTAEVDSAHWSGTEARDAVVEADVDGERVVAEVRMQLPGLAPTPLDVDASADLTGTALESLDGIVELRATRRPEGAPGLEDRLQARARLQPGGSWALDGTLRTAEGTRVAMRGNGRLVSDSLRFELDGAGAATSPSVLLGGASFDTLDMKVTGVRAAGGWETLRGDMTLRSLRWRDLVGDRVFAALSLDSIGLRLDTLDVESNVLVARGGGVLPTGGASGRIDVRADLLDLEPIRAMTGREVLGAGGGSWMVSAAGRLDSLTWETELQAEAVVVDRVRMTGLSLTGGGAFGDLGAGDSRIGETELALRLDRILLPSAEIGALEIDLAGSADSVHVTAEARVDEGRRATARVLVDPHPERKTARIDDLRFEIDEDVWQLEEVALVRYGSGVTVEPVLLGAGGQEIRFEGGVAEDGSLDLNARMDSTDVATVADLVGFPRLSGWLTGRLRVQGTTAAPVAWLDLSGALHRASRPAAPLSARVRANGRVVRGDVQLRDSGRGSLSLEGGARLAPDLDERLFGLASDSIDVTLAADSFSVRWVEAFLTEETVASLGGTLHGELSARGSSAEPGLSGALRLRQGSARILPLGVRYERMGLVVRGNGSELRVDSARVAGTEGVARGEGTIGALLPMPLDLRVELDDFRAIRTDAYWAVVSGSLEVGGETMAPRIGGEVRVESLDVFLDERVTSEGLEPVELTEEDLAALRERFGVSPDLEEGRRPFLERLTADVTVELGRDSWLRKRTSPEMAVPFSGTVEVALRPGEDPSLRGSVEVIERRGFVEQFGRRFELASGTVEFNGPPEETRVDLEAVYTIPSHDNPDDAEVTIILEVTGTQQDLGLTLSSDPAMENADIVSYVATGRPASGSLSFEGGESEGGLVAAGADYALSQMTSLIESAAARSVGLDVVEIRREGFRQATLVAGKYVTPRLYVGFAQPVSLQDGDGLSFGSEGQSELEIEYEALRWLLLNIEGSGSDLRFFLRGRRAY